MKVCLPVLPFSIKDHLLDTADDGPAEALSGVALARVPTVDQPDLTGGASPIAGAQPDLAGSAGMGVDGPVLGALALARGASLIPAALASLRISFSSRFRSFSLRFSMSVVFALTLAVISFIRYVMATYHDGA